ncbi:glutamine--fructose-6-phosphate transaminase (isomerizing) [Paludibaculum fermentans]|uniref:Glutamine--fructose-6-phosphate aminotransferase [isomerizing] n=1 Tax=Paludibaculum fermentans TaxID=1473598 RepID=A0A7S7NXL4_PALFE|nr:glutamine--fructose-6-phosphate transaminase (isomerizing) [Paludibaculum fermentans]QOY91635.1 glutamine--fructose-6-phosphate transaminase (isomerizing) [Paludibaculum fermentans]
MCGIIGYVGNKKPVPILLEGLRRLEYRGYDSAGLAVVDEDLNLHLRRVSGKLHNLEEAVRLSPVDGWYGIGHTRWATHGRPTEENAHPHRDSKGDIVVVHNGIVENYLALKQELEAEGHAFQTETDTEIIPHLVEKYFQGSLEEAVRLAVGRLRGVFAIAAISRLDPGKIVAARNGPPVVVGLGEGEYFVASDVPAILSHTRDVFFLHDGDIAVLTADGVRLMDLDGRPVKRQVSHILWDPIMAEKGGYKHFMLKEIYEQPRAVRDTILGRVGQESGRVFLDEMQIQPKEFAEFQNVRIVACGTSWHAALAGKFMIERLARIPVEVDYGSEFRYRDPIVNPNSLTVLISQSGETADTLAAQREAKSKGSRTLSICNVMGSMISREAAGTLLTHAGPEIGVASTKAFTAQLTALFILAMYLGQARGRQTPEQSQDLAQELLRIPAKLEHVLSADAHYEDLVKWLFKATDFLYLGRGIHYPIALEGALKLKEISYIHAEGYPAGEMKHGPNALIDESLPTVVLATADPEDEASVLRYEKTLSNIQEVKARGGKVVAVATEGMTDVTRSADHVIWVPPTRELLLPILEVVPLQLLAYHIAVRRGCDVDQPRNLAKSVTVE